MNNPNNHKEYVVEQYLDVAGVIFVAIDKDQRVTWVNQKGCEILGYSETEIIGHNWFVKFLPASIRAEAQDVFDRLMNDQLGMGEHFENPVLTKMGEEKIITWHNAIIKDDEGQPLGTLSSGTDITEQRQAQKELEHYKNQLESLVEKRTIQLEKSNEQLQNEIKERIRTEQVLLESQVRFARILDIASEAIISVDEAQRIVLFNQGAEKIFGYYATEIINQPLDILIPARFVEKHREHIADFTNSNEVAQLMGSRDEVFGVRKNGQEFPVSASISKLDVGDQKIFTVVLRDITKIKLAEQERERRITSLKALNESVRAITAELSLEQVLEKITQAAADLVGVEFVALGLHDGQGRLSRFITHGVGAEERAKIGPLPVGRGLLGHLLYRGESMIVEKLQKHPASVGFPENHPQMENLLGVPIYSKGKLIGALYLSNKKDETLFDEGDQQLVEMLAVHAAISIENAQLYEQTQRLAILEERERFARDLHDGIIQSIYAVGLALDQAKLDISATNYAARQQIEMSLSSLASVIRDIRNYIFDLRPHALKYKGLKERLEGLVKELRVNTLLPIDVEIAPDVDSILNETEASHIFHVAHEALSNAARHANANQMSLYLSRNSGSITLKIEDDGKGFDVKGSSPIGHHGLTNIKDRVAQLNATFNIESAPQQGTRLTLKLHTGAR